MRVGMEGWWRGSREASGVGVRMKWKAEKERERDGET